MEQVKKARRPVSMVSYIGLSMVILGNAALIYYSLLWAPDYPVLGIDADIVLLFGGIICSIIGTVLSIIGLLQVLFSKRPLSQVTICTAAMIAEGFGILLLARIFPDPFAGRRYEAKNNLSAIYTAYQQYHSDYQTFPAEPLINPSV